MKRLFLGILLMFAAIPSYSQYFSTGEDPASLKWRQMQIPGFQLIFPEDFEAKAREFAGYLIKVRESGENTLYHFPATIPVVLHTRTVRSNGLVGWAPKRMEIFTTPHQDIYAQEWLQQLALHEFRHVVQLSKIQALTPGIIRALLGEQGTALVTGLYLPFWFIEGDAVIAETALSSIGRGRLPSFLMEHKAQVIEKGIYSFDKAYNGSFRDYVPDHYKLGWYLVGHSRAKYGADLWNNALNQLAQKPWSLSPVNKVTRKMTGLTQEKLYLQAFDSLRREWEREDEAFGRETPEIITRRSKTYTSYRYNHIRDNGDILSLKTSLNQIPAFVMISPSGEEKVIYVPGQLMEGSVGYREELMVWSEYLPHPRWAHSGSTLLRLFNFSKNQLTTIKPEYKCVSPSISPDKHNVAVIETDFHNHNYLSVYNAASGRVEVRYPVPGDRYLFDPVWEDDQHLLALLLTDAGKQLVRINPYDQRIEILDFVAPGEISQLALSGRKLWFISGYTGKNELWSADLEKQKSGREAAARFGMDCPAISSNGNQVVVSDYTADGFRLIKPRLSGLEPFADLKKGEYPIAEKLAQQESGLIDFTNVDSVNYISKPYKKGLNLFNFHSRAPLWVDGGSNEVAPGTSVASQNLLGTAETTAGYKWNIDERNGKYYLRFEYRGWFPVITTELSTAGRSSSFGEITEIVKPNGELISRDTIFKRYSWNEDRAGINLRVPLNFSEGKWHTRLQPELFGSFTRFRHNGSAPPHFFSGTLNTVGYRLYFHQLMRQSIRDMQSRWGWSADMSFRHSIQGTHTMGSLGGIQLKLFLPGLVRHHGWQLRTGWQHRNRSDFRFGDAITTPWGWNPFNSQTLLSSSIRYQLPLATPDMRISKLIYIKRWRSALFYDFATFTGVVSQNSVVTGNFRKSISSAGLDLVADGHLLRFYAPVSAGVRGAWLPETGEKRVEFLFSVDFTSF